MCSPSLRGKRARVYARMSRTSGPAGGGLGGDDDRLPEPGEGGLAAGGLPDVDGHDRLADRHRVAHLLVEDEADRGVDRAVDGLAAGAQEHPGVPDRPRGEARHAAVALGPHHDRLRGLGQERRVVADARVAALQLDHAAEALEARPARQGLPHPRPRGVEGGGGAGQVHHPGRELDGERLEVGGAPALESLDALGHFERVPGGAPEGLVHVGDEGRHPLAHALADAEHGLGEGLRLVAPAEEGPVPALDVEDEGVDPLRHLLAHDRGRDEGQALDGGGHVAQRVELAVGGGDLRGLADEAQAAVAEDRAQLGRGSGGR